MNFSKEVSETWMSELIVIIPALWLDSFPMQVQPVMLRKVNGIETKHGIFDLVPFGWELRLKVQSRSIRPPVLMKKIQSIFSFSSNSLIAL